MRWNNAVNAYSLTALINPCDKLPATVGITERLVHSEDTSCVVYFLESSLLAALVWAQGSVRHLKRVTGRYRAPKWTWISCDGMVEGSQYAPYQCIQVLCIIED